MYAIELAARRRPEPPREDLTSLILGTEFGGHADDRHRLRRASSSSSSRPATTPPRPCSSSGLLALLEHPDQLAELRADPSLIPGAVEEILRWANPLHYFRRTATADTVLHGTTIAAGDKVAMIYTSANRDEDVFDDPAPLRHPPRDPTRTCRSASPSTSASACISPGSKAACSSRSCSRRSRPSSCAASRGAPGRTSTTRSSRCRSPSSPRDARSLARHRCRRSSRRRRAGVGRDASRLRACDDTDLLRVRVAGRRAGRSRRELVRRLARRHIAGRWCVASDRRTPRRDQVDAHGGGLALAAASGARCSIIWSRRHAPPATSG